MGLCGPRLQALHEWGSNQCSLGCTRMLLWIHTRIRHFPKQRQQHENKRRSERKSRRQTQTLQRRWRCATMFEKLRRRRQRRQQQQQKERQRMDGERGSSTSNRKKDGSGSKMTGGSKDLRGKWETKSKDITFIVIPKNMRPMHSSERIEEMVCELEGYRWDAILLSETWRPAKSEIWETRHKHIFMGAGKYDDKHGVGIVLNKKWRHKIIDTDYIIERAITATIVVNHQRIKLMSICIPHPGYADHHIEKMYKTIEKHTASCKRYIPIVGGDFNAELGPGHGTECKSVGKHTHTLNGGNKRGDWMKHWLMSQGFTALNTMYRKNPGKHTTYTSPKGNEKQSDDIITKRRNLKHNKDAEPNDMIQMGSDHRRVTATFMITTPERDGHRKTKKGKLETRKHEGKDQNEKKHWTREA